MYKKSTENLNCSAEVKDYVYKEYGEIFLPLFLSRGLDTVDKIKKFADPSINDLTDPYSYSDMKVAVERIRRALSGGEKILVFGDYDCDGICAVYILSDYLRSAGGNVDTFIPSRMETGYGLSVDAVVDHYENLDTELPTLLITVDCGITAKNEVNELIEELGIDVIVTDHHELPAELPDCPVLSAKRNRDTVFPDISGAGMAFMLVYALSDVYNALRYVDVCALSSIADFVPLTDDNRIIVSYGLKKINSGDCNPGIKKLVRHCRIEKVDVTDVGFSIAPRINAFGRLGDATPALDLFEKTDSFDLESVMNSMDKVNSERQEFCNGLIEDVIEKLKGTDFSKERSIVLFDKRWHPGVLGIAAAHIMQIYHRPTVLFTDSNGKLKGSGRSILGVNLYNALSYASEHVVSFGGHSRAAGVNLEVDKFDCFKKAFNQYLFDNYDDSVFQANEYYDAEIDAKSVDFEFVKKLSVFEPTGEGNPKPRFKVVNRNLRVEPFRNPTGLRIIDRGYSSSVFGKNTEYLAYKSDKIEKRFDYEFKLNYFNGNVNVDGRSTETEFVPLERDGLIEATSYFSNVAKNVIDKVETADLTSLLSGLTGFGTLFVTYDFDNFTTFSKNKDIKKQCFSLDGSANDSVVYCPMGISDARAYSKIVFLDEPYFACEGKFEAFKVEGLKRFSTDKVSVKREDMGASFGILKNAIIGQKLSFSLFADIQTAFSYYVFSELGIISDENNIPSFTNVKSDLSKSVLYRLFSENLTRGI